MRERKARFSLDEVSYFLFQLVCRTVIGSFHSLVRSFFDRRRCRSRRSWRHELRRSFEVRLVIRPVLRSLLLSLLRFDDYLGRIEVLSGEHLHEFVHVHLVRHVLRHCRERLSEDLAGVLLREPVETVVRERYRTFVDDVPDIHPVYENGFELSFLSVFRFFEGFRDLDPVLSEFVLGEVLEEHEDP